MNFRRGHSACFLYGFDYSTVAYPRLVAVMPEGSQICDSVLTLQNDGTDLFDGGSLDSYPFVDINISQPDLDSKVENLLRNSAA